MFLSGGLVFLSLLVANSVQDKVDTKAKAVVVETDSSAYKKNVEPKLLHTDPAINSAVVGVGVGVLGSLLVGALLENKNKCNNRFTRDTANARFLPGVFGPSKCPPRHNGYNNNNQYNNGYRQPSVYPQHTTGYHQPTNPYQTGPVYNPPASVPYQPVTTTAYRPVNTQPYRPVPSQNYHQPAVVAYPQPSSVYQPAGNIGYHPAQVYGQGVQGFNKQVVQTPHHQPPPPGSIGTVAQFSRSASKKGAAAPQAKSTKSSAVKFGN